MKLERDEVPAGHDPGDDTVVCRVYLHWAPTVEAATRAAFGAPSSGHVARLPDGAWTLVFSVDRAGGRRQRHFVHVDPDMIRPDRWPIVRLAAGVWDLPKSVHVPGQFHGFVTLLEAPEPAPWAPRFG